LEIQVLTTVNPQGYLPTTPDHVN